MTMSVLSDINYELDVNVKFNQYEAKRFFKNSYSSHDKFLGIPVPSLRKIANKFTKQVALEEIILLLNSPFNEKRLLALFFLIKKYQSCLEEEKYKICKIYLENFKFVNNWNLVDASAYHILGDYLVDKDKEILVKLAKSDIMWERRLSIVSTLAFIRKNQLQPTIQIAKILLNDDEDLIHKATGWMLRELGKKDEGLLINFISNHEKSMPRTMYRYAIERLK
jgi:3-methyladenine DNA glycosylase AlkD